MRGELAPQLLDLLLQLCAIDRVDDPQDALALSQGRSRRVPGLGDPGHPAATWRFTLKPDGQGTLLEQWYQMGPARSGLNVAIDAMPDKEAKIVFVRLREHETAMRHNLEEIKSRAERG